MTYNPGQFHKIVPFVKEKPDWLILGGPADGNEAQCAVKQWPKLRVVGIEPVEAHRDWQEHNGWPKGHSLLPMALSSTIGTASLRMPTENSRGASLCENRPGREVPVRTTTLDAVGNLLGPFKNAILWMDIEGWEYQALLGGRSLFESRSIQLVNLEQIERLVDEAKLIEEYMQSYGYELVHVWNEQPGLCCDKVYRRTSK